jgi:hypothetical protein
MMSVFLFIDDFSGLTDCLVIHIFLYTYLVIYSFTQSNFSYVKNLFITIVLISISVSFIHKDQCFNMFLIDLIIDLIDSY